MVLQGLVKGSVLLVILGILLAQVPLVFRKPPPGGASGFAAPGWRKVADTFRKSLDSGQEQGAAFALYYKGELVVEFSGGFADYEANVPWTKETLNLICSSSKGIAAVTMAMLVDRGFLDYSERVSHYWPEFAQNGKADITVEQLFSHQAGLTVIDEPFTSTDLLDDYDRVGRILAAQAPNWTPGTTIGYHGQTLGLYMDQLVRRVDPKKRNLPDFFEDEIANPLDLDIFFGLPREENDRMARIYELNLLDPQNLLATRYWPVIFTFATQPDSITARSIKNPTSGNPNNPKYQDVWNPSKDGYGTAVSLAKLMGILANGGSSGDVKILSPAAIERLTQPVKGGWDEVLRMNLTYGLGTTVRDTPMGSYALGAPGAGGQMIYADPANQLGWAYTTNHHSVYAIGDDPRYLALEQAIYDCLPGVRDREARERRAGS